ncbi:TetR/AcrR family transcriptional regulator [Rhodopseudomonas palustris]|uniref:Transcriptional regulator, TetR family n=1 Tax=Rhodopseudomonas palustris (strain BisB18) TaxID=316056 RepID=Q21B70_RHOPB
MPNIANHPRKLPRQARSLATVGVILDATALLLVDEGYDKTTTNRIAERAGVSIGSLYQYFPNREAVVAAVAQRVEAETSGPLWQILSDTRGQDLRGELKLIVSTSINSFAEALPLKRILLQATSMPATAQWSAAVFQNRLTVLRAFFHAHAGELREGFNSEAASLLIPRMTRSAIDAAILSRPAALVNGELEHELTTMLTSYLVDDRRTGAWRTPRSNE